MHRLRFHLLALLGICVRRAPKAINVHGAVKESIRLDEFWQLFWPDCRKVLIFDYNNSVGIDPGKLTLHAYMRSDVRWKFLVKALADVVSLKPE